MIDLKFRKRDEYGNVILTEEGLVNLLYSGNYDLSNLQVEKTEDTVLHNKWANMFDENLLPIYQEPTCSIEEFDQQHQNEWLFPQEYQEMDIENFLLDRCKTEEEVNRVKEELILYRERNLEMILRLMVYLVNTMRQKGIVWGVGRGSSCASYCLYLIGIHKVNSVLYNLDIKEFLK